MCVINRTREIADLVTNITNAHGMYILNITSGPSKLFWVMTLVV